MSEPVKYDYLLDDKPVTWRQLIKAAEGDGYEGDNGLYTTSGAAEWLRRGHGCRVRPYVAPISSGERAGE